MGHHGRDHPLDPLQGARPRLGTLAQPPHHTTERTYGPHRALNPDHGTRRLCHAGAARAGVTLPHTQASTTRPPTTRTAPTDSAVASHHSRPQAPPGHHPGTEPASQPSYPPLPMDPPGGRGLRMTPRHQPPCPGGRQCRIPGLAEMHNGGGHC